MASHARGRVSRTAVRRVAAALVAGSVLAMAAPGPAAADDLDNRRAAKQSQLDAAQTQQADLSEALEELNGKVAQTGQQLLDLQGQLPAAQAAADAAQAEVTRTQREAELAAARLSSAQQQQSELTTTIADTDAQAAAAHTALAQMGRAAARGAPDLSGLDVALAATSTEDFVQSYAQMSSALRAQSRTVDALDTLTADNRSAHTRLTSVETKISDLKDQADTKAADAQAASTAAQQAQAALVALTEQVSAEQQSLDSQRADVQAQLDAADASAAQLSSDLAAIIAQERARPTPPPAAPAPPAAGAGPSSGATLGNPTAYHPMVVTSEYGMRWQPILHIYRLHAGLDLRSHCGDPIYAARGGTVQWSMYKSGYGNQVMIDHGWVGGKSLMTSYNHLTRSVVSKGQQVAVGQLVGYAGMTGGVSTACHLHLEVYINGSTVNPRPYLGL